ncbi:CaiB Predicted acyl-CoA transferases/carnitine dehydratase [Acidimicrobiia bacterium]
MAVISGWDRAVSFADGLVKRLAEVHGVESIGGETSGAAIIAKRSAFTGLHPEAFVSAGGSCRFLVAVDGWIAVNLPRPDDLDLLPAWLGITHDSESFDVPWDEIARSVTKRNRWDLVRGAQELGLAVAAVPDARDDVDEQLAERMMAVGDQVFLSTSAGTKRTNAKPISELLVVDLSSLWAGPLCARILSDAGATVVKVESKSRPDGARLGNGDFYEWLHRGQDECSFDFATTSGRAELLALLYTADVIIEGSRPRALERLGIEPAAVVGAGSGVVWLSITAYGRTGPWRNWSGFGDDAAAAGGLADCTDGGPEFVGDAIADPLTGLLAASAVLDTIADGGGVCIDVALREVARCAAGISSVSP